MNNGQQLLTQSVDPQGAGYQDPSAQAFDKIKPVVGSIRERVLAAITGAGTQGMTASQIISLLGELDYSVRPRITELRKAGIIQALPETRENGRKNAETIFVLGDADKAQPKPKYDVDTYVSVLQAVNFDADDVMRMGLWADMKEGRPFWKEVYYKLVDAE